jgi:hypothetical protein
VADSIRTVQGERPNSAAAAAEIKRTKTWRPLVTVVGFRASMG